MFQSARLASRVLILLFLLAVLFQFEPSLAGTVPTKDADATGSNTSGTLASADPGTLSDTNIFTGNSQDEGYCIDAASFPNPVVVTSVTFKMRKSLGSPTGTLTGKIYSVAFTCAGLSGSASTTQGTSTNSISMSGLPTSYTLETFNFASISLPALTSGNSYVFTALSSGCGCDSLNTVSLGNAGTGTIGRYANRVGSWNTAANKDTFITVTGTSLSFTMSLTTASNYELVIVSIFANGNTGIAVSDTSSLTWTQRTSIGQLFEWFATSQGVLSSDTITVTFSSGTAIASATAISFSGVTFNNPFDPADTTQKPQTSTTGCTTAGAYSHVTNPNGIALGLFASDTSSPSMTTTSGLTLLAATTNAPVGFLSEPAPTNLLISGTFASPCSGSNTSYLIADGVAGPTPGSSGPPPTTPSSGGGGFGTWAPLNTTAVAQTLIQPVGVSLTLPVTSSIFLIGLIMTAGFFAGPKRRREPRLVL